MSRGLGDVYKRQLRVVSPEVVTGSKDLVCHNNVSTKKEPTVDLFTEISDN